MTQKIVIGLLWLSVVILEASEAELVEGYPCIRRNNQIYCTGLGSPRLTEKIDKFIDENKALIRRMFGDFEEPDHEFNPNVGRDDHNGHIIHKRPKRAKSNSYNSNKIDSCESSVEIVTPYWASNSAGKIRAIVNTQHLQQAIQQEVCQSVQTKRCNNDCSCEQKYKWHRLLAYDPDDDCKGIFMDWFLFPSCCVCRCNVL
ncbi:protein spaetzle 3-like [Oppia nitens]|uniref:protein spaetzle 3-like n=1 Tax=Oppia nitens TaxID=1686743 RepID=UPI0023DB8B54|nr:protein spaetzle 3-like [Oppia nitens]